VTGSVLFPRKEPEVRGGEEQARTRPENGGKGHFIKTKKKREKMSRQAVGAGEAKQLEWGLITKDRGRARRETPGGILIPVGVGEGGKNPV